jgi:hypothetical protein
MSQSRGRGRAHPASRSADYKLTASGLVEPSCMKGKIAMGTGMRRSVLTASVFVLAAAGGAVGNQLSHRLDTAAVSFGVLVVLGTAAAVWLDRTALPGTPPTGAATSRSAQSEGSSGPLDDSRHTNPGRTESINQVSFLGDAEDIQIGDHNTMNIEYGRPRQRRSDQPHSK